MIIHIKGGFTISYFTLKLYEILGLLNTFLSDPIINFSRSSTIPILGAFLIGILGL